MEVGSSGEGMYSIPLELPIGRVGMSPGLVLSYSSDLGYGNCGYGFVLEGGSRIERSSRSMNRDGMVTGIDLDEWDRYVWEGMELESVSEGRLGNGNRYIDYRTSPYSKVRIRGYVSGGEIEGIYQFRVKYPDGSVAWYGYTANSSRIMHRQAGEEGGTAVLKWELDRVYDSYGQGIMYKYSQKIGERGVISYGMSEILYTCSFEIESGKLLDREGDILQRVVLEWEEVDWGVGGYFLGGKQELDRRLRRVETYSGGAIVKRYVLGYSDDAVNRDRVSVTKSGRVRLVSVEECDGRGHCKPSTRFSWSESHLVFREEDNNDGEVVLNEEVRYQFSTKPMVLDIDGDGLSEEFGSVRIEELGGDVRYRYGVRFSDGSWVISGIKSYAYRGDMESIVSPLQAQSVLVQPMNYDGRGGIDFLWVKQLSHSDSHIEQCEAYMSNAYVLVSELDAAGRFSGLRKIDTGIPLYPEDNPSLLNGCPVVGGTSNPWMNDLGTIQLGDMNGDGLDDMITIRYTGEEWSWNSGAGATFVYYENMGGRYSIEYEDTEVSAPGRDYRIGFKHEMFVMDGDGDGADELYYHRGDSWMRYDRNHRHRLRGLQRLGSVEVYGLEEEVESLSLPSNYSGYRSYRLDMNGDGLPDVLTFPGNSKDYSRIEEGGRIYVQYNKGDGSFTGREAIEYKREGGEEVREDLAFSLGRGFGQIYPGDMNGDGMVDVVLSGLDSEDRGKWYLLERRGSVYILRELAALPVGSISPLLRGGIGGAALQLHPWDIDHLSWFNIGDRDGDGDIDIYMRGLEGGVNVCKVYHYRIAEF